jgi:hypothetical protein
VSPVKYELGFYIPEEDIPHSDRRDNDKPYISGHVHVRISPTPSLYCGGTTNGYVTLIVQSRVTVPCPIYIDIHYQASTRELNISVAWSVVI